MIKIYGIAISNYYNKIILALMYKGLGYQEVPTAPSQEPEMLSQSPMGKIPYLEVDGRFITESNAILEYLDSAFPETDRLFPEEPIEAAKCREVICYIDMYVDAQSRRILPMAFFGAPRVEQTIEEVEVNLAKNVIALQKLVTFKPFINSDKITAADLSAITTLTLASNVLLKLGCADPLANFEGLSSYYQMMRTLPDVQVVEAANAKAIAKILSR